ncbi:hypothetical protein [Microbacterium gorillae]|uniref:hypothetical protein n=1 Tax=Microbacterium gorillae TaxID=1231063 RepID=UPI000B238802|nr:hypothetical protein [Microbacterium gorillae]
MPLPYQPPAFPLFEGRFADSDVGPVNRWIHGWNGQIGFPPTDVTLGVDTGDGRALVTSCLPWNVESDPRIFAFMAANVLDGSARLSSAVELLDTALRDSEWARGTLLLDGQPIAVMRGAFHTASVAYSLADGVHVTVAWRGDVSLARIGAEELRRYPADPLLPHSYDDLIAQQFEAG